MVVTIPLFVGGMPGGMELAVILLIAILLFGANKIPKLARSTGEAMGEFKKGREEVEQELQEIQETGEASVESETATETATETEPEPEIGTEETELETETERSEQ